MYLPLVASYSTHESADLEVRRHRFCQYYQSTQIPYINDLFIFNLLWEEITTRKLPYGPSHRILREILRRVQSGNHSDKLYILSEWFLRYFTEPSRKILYLFGLVTAVKYIEDPKWLKLFLLPVDELEFVHWKDLLGQILGQPQISWEKVEILLSHLGSNKRSSMALEYALVANNMEPSRFVFLFEDEMGTITRQVVESLF